MPSILDAYVLILASTSQSVQPGTMFGNYFFHLNKY